MIDTYIVSSDLTVLNSFCISFKNILGPSSGRAATVGYTDEFGNEIPSQEQIGDLSKYYACVRSMESPVLPTGIELCDSSTCVALLGDWA